MFSEGIQNSTKDKSGGANTQQYNQQTTLLRTYATNVINDDTGKYSQEQKNFAKDFLEGRMNFNNFLMKANLQSDFQKFLDEQYAKGKDDISRVFSSGNPVTEKVLADTTDENWRKFQAEAQLTANKLADMLDPKKRKEEGPKTDVV